MSRSRQFSLRNSSDADEVIDVLEMDNENVHQQKPMARDLRDQPPVPVPGGVQNPVTRKPAATCAYAVRSTSNMLNI